MHLFSVVGKFGLLTSLVVFLTLTKPSETAYSGKIYVKTRLWHDEITSFEKTPQLRKEILYPPYKICHPPMKVPDKISVKTTKDSLRNETTWSEFLTEYSSDFGKEIENWRDALGDTVVASESQWRTLLSYVFFMLMIIAAFVISLFVIPIIGGILFMIGSLAWFSIFHPEMKRLVRRLYIIHEKIAHKKTKLTSKKGTTQARKPQLPFFLREYNDEDLPVELVFSEEEDSESQDSEEGFDNIESAKKSKRPVVNKKLVAQLEKTEHRIEKSKQHEH